MSPRVNLSVMSDVLDKKVSKNNLFTVLTWVANPSTGAVIDLLSGDSNASERYDLSKVKGETESIRYVMITEGCRM